MINKVQHPVLSELRYGSTWILFLLGTITFGIYLAHYAKRQAGIINRYCRPMDWIEASFLNTILWVSYLSLVLYIGSFYVDSAHPVAAFSAMMRVLHGVLLAVWGFKARNRMNEILGARIGEREWFHGFWAVLFATLYFNFKVNHLRKSKMTRGSEE